MRRRSLLIYKSNEIKSKDATAGDIVLYDRQKQKKIIVKLDEYTLDKYTSDKYTPIGVVVVPGTHDVYGDGSCGVMSLVRMSYLTPQTGTTDDVTMYWGEYPGNMFGNKFHQAIPVVGDSATDAGDENSTIEDVIYGAGYNSGLPNQFYTDIQCPHDTNAYYYSKAFLYIPSPYLTDDSRNINYLMEAGWPEQNQYSPFKDFNGLGNTEVIIQTRGQKDYDSWTPSKDVTTDYPAASCCDMFYTEGTLQGDWYLPACGELCYILPRSSKINSALAKLNQIEIKSYEQFWTSTNFNESSSWRVSAQYHIFGATTNRASNVVAFTRIKI